MEDKKDIVKFPQFTAIYVATHIDFGHIFITFNAPKLRNKYFTLMVAELIKLGPSIAKLANPEVDFKGEKAGTLIVVRKKRLYVVPSKEGLPTALATGIQALRLILAIQIQKNATYISIKVCAGEENNKYIISFPSIKTEPYSKISSKIKRFDNSPIYFCTPEK
jgi:hypothetical protein